ncbi:MAG: DNA-binding response regulator [Gammaproteobacteria bacterium RBG_16_66_13]|nr:MAG: DNA-binding response regulator [Gammaproteobacteria bacterium RBG_16_66_13]
MARIRILIADDHGVLRAGLKALFNAQPDMEVCGEAADGQEAIAVATSAAPDVVLLDLKMPGLGGAEAIGRIRAAHPGAKVLVLTMYDDESYLRKVLDAGASGYVLKRAADVELLSAIRSVHEGGIYLDPALGRAVVEGFLAVRPASGKARAEEGEADPLSDREREVLRLLAYGYTNRQIAEKLFLSVKTVEGYKARIVEKLGLRGRAALTRYALEKGLLSDEA